MKKRVQQLAVVSLSFLGGMLVAQEQATRRVPQFENEHAEVWKSIIMPGQPLSMHRHDDPRAIIALKGGTLNVVSETGAERAMTWETGNAYWLTADPPGELHGDVNAGEDPIEVIVVQLKGAGPARPGTMSTPATDVTAADIQATKAEAIANGVTDIPVRTVDAGGHNVGIGVVQRPAGARGGAAAHTEVTEVYHVLEGSATLVTGGTIVDPRPRASDARNVTQINGPGISGTSIEGGVTRGISKGDMIVIPAGTPHWFPEVHESVAYAVVRVDPGQVVNLK